MNRIFKIIALFIFASLSRHAMGQSQRPKKHNHPSGKQHAVSLGAAVPLGNFSSTHHLGISVNYSWSDHRFGGMDVKPVKLFGIMASSGMDYYFGKKETVSGYTYDYHRYIFIYAGAGVICNPWNKGNIRLSAGPSLGIYNGHTQFNIGSSLEGSYYLKRKLAVSPAIIFMKETGAGPLWAASIKATWTF